MTSQTIIADVHAVLIPAFSETRLSDAARGFLSNGGCSILLGETRQEYCAREMSTVRRTHEQVETLRELVEEARSLAGDVIVAVDHEISGICRLHDLVPPFPPPEEICDMDREYFAALCVSIAEAIKKVGVNCVLGPVVDVVTGKNPWLSGRTWSDDPALIADRSSTFIRVLQDRGIAATAKHFPGYSVLERDPAVDAQARNVESPESVQNGFTPFAEAIKSNVEIIMTGPAIVEAIDKENAASLSPRIISVLRKELGFMGVVMSDDLDAEAILRGRPIARVAVEALKAGSDYLLVADSGDQIEVIISAIADAVDSGELSRERVHDAAAKVRFLAEKYRH